MAVQGATDEPPAPSASFRGHLLDLLAYLELERGLSRNTLASYRADLLGFGSYLAGRGLDVEDVRPRDVADHLAELASAADGAPVRTSTLKRKAASLRALYRHLRREGLVEDRKSTRL